MLIILLISFLLSFNTIYKSRTNKQEIVEIVFSDFKHTISHLFLVSEDNGILERLENIKGYTINYYTCDKNRTLLEKHIEPKKDTVTILKFNIRRYYEEFIILGITKDNLIFMIRNEDCNINGKMIAMKSVDNKLEEKLKDVEIKSF